MLEDDAGVLWWGQYHGPWTEFHFTEIEWRELLPLPWDHLPGLLGAIGAGAAIGGGSGDNNKSPQAPSYQLTTEEDQPVNGRIEATDPDGDRLTYLPGTPPGHGTVVIHPDGSYTYTPDPDFHGQDSFTVIVDDGKGGKTTSTVTVDVTPVNDAPQVATPIDAQNGQDAQPVNWDASTHFKDVDGDALTYDATGLPPGLSIDPDTGLISGTIDPSASQGGPGNDGVYTVTITATDADGATATQTFTWTVTNPAPVAVDDVASTAEDTPLSGNVLTDADSNGDTDTDPDGDTLTVTLVEVEGTPHTVPDGGSVIVTVTGGTLEMSSNGDYTFTPTPDWHGTVPPITYTVSDGEGGTDTATLRITVDPVNDAPVIDAGSDLEGTVIEAGIADGEPVAGTPTATGTLTATDVDLEDTLTWSVLGTPDTTYGTFNLTADGTWTYTLNNASPATQGLTKGQTVTLEYQVQVSDGHGGTAQQTVTITIQGTNDAPEVNPESATVKESGVSGGNTAEPGTPSADGNVLSNDSDPDDGETATLQVVEAGLEGDPASAVTAGGTQLAGVYGTLTIHPDGTYTYTLDNTSNATQALAQGASATERFTYVVEDAQGERVSSTLTVTVNGTNDQPEIVVEQPDDVAGEVTERGTANPDEEATVSGTLTATDPDDGAQLSWSVVDGNGTYGTLTVDANGQWTYTLDNARQATQELNDGDTKVEEFTVRVTDEHGAYHDQKITITVHGRNDEVQVSDGNASTDEDTPLTGTLRDLATDPDDEIELVSYRIGDSLDVHLADQNVDVHDPVTNEKLGTIVIAANGDYTFTPTGNYSGPVPAIHFTVREAGGGAEGEGTLNITVNPVADKPDLGTPDALAPVLEDGSLTLGLKLPAATDATDLNGAAAGDQPELLGPITLTIGDLGASGVTLLNGADVLTPVGNELTIVIVATPGSTTPLAGYHIAEDMPAPGTPGVYYLTADEFTALKAAPAPDSGANFTVTVSVSSYEVDADGRPRDGVPEATESVTYQVDVHAVTDPVQLGLTENTLTIAEDTTLNLSTYLQPQPTGDLSDGSESFWYVIDGLPQGTRVTFAGKTYTADATGTVTTDPTNDTDVLADVRIRPPVNYSGVIPDIQITLHRQDSDPDSPDNVPTVESDAVTLSLTVTPVAGDVQAGGVTTTEDQPAAVLQNLALTDTTAGDERITELTIKIPDGWTFAGADPGTPDGWTGNHDPGAGTVTIQFDDALDAAGFANALAQVKAWVQLQPPPHSSKDADVRVDVTTRDHNPDVAPASDTHTTTSTLDIRVTVRPAAERTDSDSADPAGLDVTMHGNEDYEGQPGKEDEWFALGTDTTDATNTGGVTLSDDWNNEDGDEFLYAVLTPSLSDAGPGDTVNGTTFRFHDGSEWHERTYNGEAVWVPVAYLDTLQVKAPEHVSGTLTITMQAGTVDYDDDAEIDPTDIPLDPPRTSGPGVSVAVSGSATLGSIVIAPAVDDLTLSLSAHAVGQEDEKIPLSIRAASSDPSETVTLTIGNIPDGARLLVNDVEVSVVNGQAEIEGYLPTTRLEIIPPANSNETFSLQVWAVAKESDGTQSAPTPVRTLDVTVLGVADEATVTLKPGPHTYQEADLDGGASVGLDELIDSVSSGDTDGSERWGVRISGLPEGFTVTGAALIGGSGPTRVWVADAGQLDSVRIHAPANYSGTVNFQVAGVTTENDGDSRTGAAQTVSFTVRPSAEATATDSAVLKEDTLMPIDLRIQHQNGDTDEELGKVYIHEDALADPGFTLYLGADQLADLAATLDTYTDGSDLYYVIPAAQVAQLQAQGAAHADDVLGSFRYKYEVIDRAPGGLEDVQLKEGVFTLSASPVTDPVEVSITDITGTDVVATEEHADDDASPDTVEVNSIGELTVKLHVSSPDHDGSEHVIRVLIEGVPTGVSVNGAEMLQVGQWLLVYEGADAQSITAGGIDIPVTFTVGQDAYAHNNLEHHITMTVQSRDRGDRADIDTDIVQDSVTWHLRVNLEPVEGGEAPFIKTWAFNHEHVAEDQAFRLADIIDAEIELRTISVPNILTVKLTEVPAGTTVEGMVFTYVDGQPTWTASVTLPAGTSVEQGQARLIELLEGIRLTAPANSNDNNAAGTFNFNAQLSVATLGGTANVREIDKDDLVLEVDPVSDVPVVTVSAPDIGENDGTGIAVTISVDYPDDGPYAQLVDGKLYVQVQAGPGNEGQLLYEGSPLVPVLVAGEPALPDGTYYVIDLPPGATSVDLLYQPDHPVPGNVSFTAYVQAQEVNAIDPPVVLGQHGTTANILVTNDGVEVSTPLPWSGPEASDASRAHAIELVGLDVSLVDDDGSEAIRSVVLNGVPVGFLVYVGNDAASATLAPNAGGDNLTNSWVLSANGGLPPYVAILPPAHWSGTIDGLTLTVESGETSLAQTRRETIALQAELVVTPVADGLTLAPTASFGKAGSIIELNLNVAMADPQAVPSVAPDESVETVTVQLTGLGEHAAFYLGSTLLDAGRVAYDAGSDTYTLRGLTQADVDKLGVVQAAAALTDQDPAASGVQVGVTAWTVEGATGTRSAEVSDVLTLQIAPVRPTSGDDTLLWAGAGQPVINGQRGDDTVALRLGEDVSGNELALGLRNIEVLDLRIDGANEVTDLKLEDVLSLTDARNTLTILGTADDRVELGAGWTLAGSSGGYTEYSGVVGGSTVRVLIDDQVEVLHA